MRRAVILVLVIAAATVALADSRREIKQKKRAVREMLETLASEEGDIIAAMEALEESAIVEQAAFEAAEKRVTVTEASLSEVRADLAATEETLRLRRARLAPRLVARYKAGRTGYLPMLLSSGSPTEFARRRRMLSWIVRNDVQAMNEIRGLAEHLAAREQELETLESQLQQLRQSAAVRLAAVDLARTERQDALALLRDEQSMQVHVLAGLEKAERRLQGLVRSLGGGRPVPGATGFAALRGSLPMPVAGVIEQHFGSERDPRYDTVILHKGIDIRAPKGTLVKAVAAGRVAHAGSLRGYGNLIILEHGDAYYTLMAHLEQIEVVSGKLVEQGDPIGRVGDTGSLKGAYLYFEIRKRGQAVDPVRWLE